MKVTPEHLRHASREERLGDNMPEWPRQETERMERERQERERSRLAAEAGEKAAEEAEKVRLQAMDVAKQKDAEVGGGDTSSGVAGDGPCACTPSGISPASGGVDTSHKGCGAAAANTELSGLGRVCYVVSPGECDDARPSGSFEGAAWRFCKD